MTFNETNKPTLVETLFILKPNASNKEFLKFTILELILNGSLELKKEVKHLTSFKPLQRFFYLKKY